jgi:hypothetical protein
MLQLNPPIPVEVIGRGKGYAVVLIDYSQEHDLMWVVFDDVTRECWTVSNKLIRAQVNISMGRFHNGQRREREGSGPGPGDDQM